MEGRYALSTTEEEDVIFKGRRKCRNLCLAPYDILVVSMDQWINQQRRSTRVHYC